MAAHKRHYVYSLADPRDLSGHGPRVFYIGKGAAARARAHTHRVVIKDNEKSAKAELIREILADGEEVVVTIIKRFVEEEAAYEYERELIDKMDGLLNDKKGGAGRRAAAVETEIIPPGLSSAPPKAAAVVLTPKQEAFCQAYIETGNASEAYRASYSTAKMKSVTVNREAKALLDNHKITTRLNELNRVHQVRHMDTVDSLCHELNEHREHAIQTAQIGAANQATLGKARLLGYLIDRQQTQSEHNVNIQVVTGVPRNPI